tara:strand:- start:7182 stop:8186 length:1005 start_codon:yes stop_codon:yes gene_type:complete
MSIALVILNWNGKKLLQRFLPDLVRYSKEAKIYLIDNASEDDSISFVKKEFTEITIIQNNENLGYAGGYNTGLKEIDEDILCLINNDLRVSKNWLLPIIEIFEKNPDTAIAQPHILDEKDPSKFEYAGAAGGYVDRFGYPFCRGRIFHHLEKDLGQYDKNKTIFWASGACFFIRNKIFKSAKGFDEDFFMHQEEIDLCWRVYNQGKEIYSIGKSKVYHLGGGSLPDSPKKVFYNFRNSMYLILKNVPSIPLFFIFLARLFLDGIAGIHFLLKGEVKNFLSIIKAHFFIYLNIFKILRKRQEIVTDRPYFLTNSVVFQFFLKKKCKYSDLKFPES